MTIKQWRHGAEIVAILAAGPRMKWQVYIGLAPIRPQYALTVRKSADGSLAIDGRAPNDSGEEYVPL